MKPNHRKKIFTREACESVLAMVNMGKVRIIKEHTPDGPVYVAESVSGTPIWVIGERYNYLFEKVLSERGAGDGLFESLPQTTRLGG